MAAVPKQRYLDEELGEGMIVCTSTLLYTYRDRPRLRIEGLGGSRKATRQGTESTL